MKIELTDIEYKKLLELLHFTDNFLTYSEKILTEDQKKDYKKIYKKIYSYYKGDDNTFNILKGTFRFSEEPSELSDKIQDNLEIQFNDLIKNWAYKYIAREFVKKEFPNVKFFLNEKDTTDSKQTKDFIVEEMEKYLKEFEQNDLENLRFKFFKNNR